MLEIFLWIMGIIFGAALVYGVMSFWKLCLNDTFQRKYGANSTQYLYLIGLGAIIVSWGMDYNFYAFGIVAIIANLLFLICQGVNPLDFLNVIIWHTLFAGIVTMGILAAVCCLLCLVCGGCASDSDEDYDRRRRY